MILPFAHREGSTPTLLDGADCAELLTEGFERWHDVRLADKTRVSDALERRGAGLPFRIPVDTGLAIARQLGAGKLVMGQLWNFADTMRLTVNLYDAARGGALVRHTAARVFGTPGQIGAVFNVLADSLLGAGLFTGSYGAGAELTRSLRALTAHNLGERATRAWDLAGAARYFREAITADSAFAHAHLALGEVLLWAADSSPEAMRDRIVIARHADGLLPRLDATDRTLLLAQQAMFERRWPDACQRYREALQADSSSFAAWYGLAECNAEDPVVIRDSTDTTRYVFRGSWHTAVLAYRRALLLAPSFNFTFGSRASERLTRLLPVETYWWRGGRFDGVAYFAFPELEAETLVFHPASGAVAAGRSRPPTQAAALARGRSILIEVTTAWAEAFPGEPRAHRALAYALEVTGKIVPTALDLRSALSELQAAQRRERRSDERVRDGVAAVRLLVKAGEFDAARRLADSLLRVPLRPIAGIAGVAVLLGRPALAARLVAPEDPATEVRLSADNQPVRVPLEATRAGLALLAYAAAGAPQESVVVYERRIEELVARLPAAGRPRARSALLDAAAELVFNEIGLRPAHRSTPPGPDGTMAMQWALAHNDTAWVRASLDAKLKESGGAPSTEDAPADGVYLDALLYLSVGDTATAEQALDIPLNNLSGVHTALLRYLPLAGALVRMMALRAELAAARGDALTARRWAKAVVALWSGAEPALQPTVARMTRIAARTQ